MNEFWYFSKIKQWCAPCMYYQMPPQMARLRWRITTQIAFELLFSAVYFQIFQMFPQIACLWGCIVTLVAFVWHFTAMSFKMHFQTVCPRRCTFTLVAFVWLQCVFSNKPPNGLHGFSPLCVLNVRIFWPSRAVVGPQLTGQSMWWNATMSFPTWWWWRRRKSRGYTYGGFKYHHQTPGSH